jgi:hypothetical protein
MKNDPTPSPPSMLPMTLFVGLALVATIVAIVVWLWTAEPPPNAKAIERFAELLAPEKVLTPEEIFLAMAGKLPANRKGTRDVAAAAGMLAPPRVEWGGWGRDEKQRNEAIADLALRDGKMAVKKVTRGWEAGVHRLQVSGTFTSPIHAALKEYFVYTLKDPVILVRAEGDKVRPVGIEAGVTERELNNDEALVRRFKGRGAADELTPPIPTTEEPVSEEQADLWRADFALRHPGLAVVKVSDAGKGRFRLEMKGTINIPAIKVRDKAGRVTSPNVSLTNPELIVEVHRGEDRDRIRALALE